MIYLEFEIYKNKYLEAQEAYDAVLSEKEHLFCIEKSFDDYMRLREDMRIDEKLNEIKSILESRLMLMELKNKELRTSCDLIDKIYVLKFLDGAKPFRIAKKLNYSESQIYRIINCIQKSLKDAKKCENKSDKFIL